MPNLGHQAHSFHGPLDEIGAPYAAVEAHIRLLRATALLRRGRITERLPLAPVRNVHVGPLQPVRVILVVSRGGVDPLQSPAIWLGTAPEDVHGIYGLLLQLSPSQRPSFFPVIEELGFRSFL